MVALRSAHAPPPQQKPRRSPPCARRRSRSRSTSTRRTTSLRTLTLCMLHNDVSYRRCQQALDAVRQGRGAGGGARALREALLGEAPLAPAPALPLPETALFAARGSTRASATPSPLRSPRGPSPASTGRRAPARPQRSSSSATGGARGERVLASAASKMWRSTIWRSASSPARSRRASCGSATRRACCRACSTPRSTRASRAPTSRGSPPTCAELDAAQKKLRGERGQGGARARAARIRGALRKELASRQQRAVVEVLEQAQVVLCTNSGAQDRALRSAARRPRLTSW